MDIWRAAEVLNRRKWLILFSMVVALVLAFGATRLTGSRWMATVTFMTPETSSLTSVTGESRRPPTHQEMKTLEAMYTAILTSREVVLPAYQKIKEDLPTDNGIFDSIELEAKGARMYEAHVYNSNPELAEKIANALADSFVERNRSLNTEQSANVVALLEQQLRELDAKLAKARRAYRTYSSKNKVLGNPDQELELSISEIESTRLKRNQVREDLASMTARLQKAQSDLAALEPTLRGARPDLTGPRAESIAAELSQVEAKLASLQGRYGNEHPEIKEARSARQELQSRLKIAQAEEVRTAEYAEKLAERAALQRTIREIQPNMAELEAQARTLDTTMVEIEGRLERSKALGDPFGSLASEVAMLVANRENLAARLNAAQMALDVTRRNNPMVIMSRVNELNPPVNVTAGRTKKMIILAALCALIGTSGLIIALDSVDRRLKTVNEAEQVLPARVLAAIPQPEGQLSYSELARISELQPRSLPAESYRFLGLHLLSAAGPNVRSLMALSAKAEQGSTTAITNLAITLAQAGHKVVLVDANIRTPELHQVFNTENEFGFSDLVMDPTVSSFEKAMTATSVPNLRIITSGRTPDNPWELFRSENLVGVSDRLREMADYVLFDTPSGTLFTDALNLAPIVDAAFLCVRAFETPSGAEQRLIDLVNQSNVTVLGAVLNHVPASMVAGYENYQHYYAPALRSLTAPAVGGSDAIAIASQQRPQQTSMVDMPDMIGASGSSDQGAKKEM